MGGFVHIVEVSMLGEVSLPIISPSRLTLLHRLLVLLTVATLFDDVVAAGVGVAVAVDVPPVADAESAGVLGNVKSSDVSAFDLELLTAGFVDITGDFWCDDNL